MAAATKCADCRQAIDASPLSEDVLNCPACLESFTRLHELVEELEHYDPSVAPEILTAEELAAKLNPLPVAGKVGRVRDDVRYQQWGLAQHLLAASRGLWCSDPELAHELAVVAVEVADRVDAKTYHPLWVADLRAKARAYLANTFRILGEFQDAERSFMKAEGYVLRGTGRGRARAQVFALKSSLLLDQRRHVEAGLLLEFVMAHYAGRMTATPWPAPASSSPPSRTAAKSTPAPRRSAPGRSPTSTRRRTVTCGRWRSRTPPVTPSPPETSSGHGQCSMTCRRRRTATWTPPPVDRREPLAG